MGIYDDADTREARGGDASNAAVPTMSVSSTVATTMPFSNVKDYYTYLWSKNWHKMKMVIPDFTPEFIDSLVSSDNGMFSKGFTTCSAILLILLKNSVTMQRKRKISDVNDKKISRIDIIPKFMQTADCKTIKIAVLMFCLPATSPIEITLKRDIILSIIAGHIKSNVMDIIKKYYTLRDQSNIISSDKNESKVKIASNNLREYTHVNVDKIESKTKRILIRGLLDSADVIKDRNYGKLAFFVDVDIYCNLLREHINLYRNYYPFEALMMRYVDICVARKDQKIQKTLLYDEFAVNRSATLNRMIENLVPVLTNRGEYNVSKITAAKKKQQQLFEDDRVYEVFVGAPDFHKHVTYTFKRYNDKIYYIGQYKGCLYDVIGDEHGLFNALCWSERLAKIPGRTCVQIQEKTGRELNALNVSATLGLVWKEDDMYNYTVHTFKLKKDAAVAGAASNEESPSPNAADTASLKTSGGDGKAAARGGERQKDFRYDDTDEDEDENEEENENEQDATAAANNDDNDDGDEVVDERRAKRHAEKTTVRGGGDDGRQKTTAKKRKHSSVNRGEAGEDGAILASGGNSRHASRASSPRNFPKITKY